MSHSANTKCSKLVSCTERKAATIICSCHTAVNESIIVSALPELMLRFIWCFNDAPLHLGLSFKFVPIYISVCHLSLCELDFNIHRDVELEIIQGTH